MNGFSDVARDARALDHRLAVRGRAGSETDPCRGTSSGRRARRPRRSRAGTRSRSARQSSETPRPASADRPRSPCTPGTNVPRLARSTNSSNDVSFMLHRVSLMASSGPSAASRITRSGRPLAGPPFELRAAPARPACRGRRWSGSRPRARRAAGACRPGCKPGRTRAAVEPEPSGSGDSSTSGAVPTGVALTSTSQLPGAGGHVPTVAPVIAATVRAWSRAARRDGRRARRPTAAPRPPARAAPPAPSTVARRPCSAHRDCSGARKPPRRCCMPTHLVPLRRSVLTALDAPAHGIGFVGALERVHLERRGHARARQVDARRQTSGSRRSRRRPAADTRHRCAPRETPRCASPATANGRPGGRRRRRSRSRSRCGGSANSSLSRCALICPGATPSPA